MFGFLIFGNGDMIYCSQGKQIAHNELTTNEHKWTQRIWDVGYGGLRIQRTIISRDSETSSEWQRQKQYLVGVECGYSTPRLKYGIWDIGFRIWWVKNCRLRRVKSALFFQYVKGLNKPMAGLWKQG